ncbi:Solute carrier family 30 member 8 [Intoshia linei]|uniref:Solute carrier family 30 member 8 n=1 Tax=Intoshia linei TaxID=1819745 RepID=A0A177BCD6_9BILA|nr:Solute carrier family 30 member 8 [Intoshia linei]
MDSIKHKLKTNTVRLSIMLFLTSLFFVIELVVGQKTNSLALVSDAYHMLSDLIALVIGLVSLRWSKRRSKRNTFGWARAEVLGALVNAVYLAALCFTIVIESIQKITTIATMSEDDVKMDNHYLIDKKNFNLLLIVGGVGLAINVVGLIVLGGHSHGHSHEDDHGHDHAHSHEKSIKSSNEIKNENYTTRELFELKTDMENSNTSISTDDIVPKSIDNCCEIIEMNKNTKQKHASAADNLNMKGVILHVMGDALGSIVVIISILIMKYVEGDWTQFIDPILSLLLVCIIIASLLPLFKKSALILLQTVPSNINIKALENKLLRNIQGISAVHEFHVWQLAGKRIIASIHIRVRTIQQYMMIAKLVKDFFHDNGIHSITVQPEFMESENDTTQSERESLSPCLLACDTQHCDEFYCFVGQKTNSLALVSDAYHMLSDIMSLIIGIIALQISTRQSRQNTFGWVRAEIVGALVNSVYMGALCFIIVTEAIQKITLLATLDKNDASNIKLLIEDKNVNLLLIVASIGLAINILGLCIIGDYHGHDHSHNHKPSDAEYYSLIETKNNCSAYESTHQKNDQKKKQKKQFVLFRIFISCLSDNLNMQGVALHIAGDTLGSIVVIISVLIIKYVKSDWAQFVDPIISLLLVTIILCGTIPLFKRASLILMQTAPVNMNIDRLKQLLENIPGIKAIHEFHVWQLTCNSVIASIHISCKNVDSYMIIAKMVKELFHDNGIHNTTVQPEFIQSGNKPKIPCILKCQTGECEKYYCCQE